MYFSALLYGRNFKGRNFTTQQPSYVDKKHSTRLHINHKIYTDNPTEA